MTTTVSLRAEHLGEYLAAAALTLWQPGHWPSPDQYSHHGDLPTKGDIADRLFAAIEIAHEPHLAADPHPALVAHAGRSTWPLTLTQLADALDEWTIDELLPGRWTRRSVAAGWMIDDGWRLPPSALLHASPAALRAQDDPITHTVPVAVATLAAIAVPHIGATIITAADGRLHATPWHGHAGDLPDPTSTSWAITWRRRRRPGEGHAGAWGPDRITTLDPVTPTEWITARITGAPFPALTAARQLVAPSPVAEPVGLTELADHLQVKRGTVDQWQARDLLPPPRWTVGGRPAWDWTADIIPWATATGRMPSTR